MMDKKSYTTTQILRAYVDYITIFCGDKCNFKSENWKIARKAFHDGTISILTLENNNFLNKNKNKMETI